MAYKFIERYKILRSKGENRNDIILEMYEDKDKAINHARRYVKLFKDNNIRVELYRYANEKNFEKGLHYDSKGIWNSYFHD